MEKQYWKEFLLFFRGIQLCLPYVLIPETDLPQSLPGSCPRVPFQMAFLWFYKRRACFLLNLNCLSSSQTKEYSEILKYLMSMLRKWVINRETNLSEVKLFSVKLKNDFFVTLYIIKTVCVCAHSVVCKSLQPHRLYRACQAPLSNNFLRKNTGVGCHSLLQGIFPTQGSCISLISCIGRQILYH